MKISIILEALTGKFETDTKRASSNFQREMKKMQRDVGKFVFSIRGLLTGAFFGFSLAGVVRETAKAEQQLAQLDAALKSTRGAAGLTRQQLLDMADGFSQATTHSRDEIIKAQTRLLAYTTIMGKEFPRAMQIAIDQSVRLGMGIEQSAEIIGRALETPSKGVASLTRQGFQFSEAQKRLLKSLQDTGRLAEAQAIVMDVLEESYGGAARAARDTFGGALTSVKNSFTELLAVRGGLPDATRRLNELSSILKDPAVLAAADKLTSTLISGFTRVAKAITDTIGTIKFLGEELAATFGGAAIDDVVRLEEQLDELLSMRKWSRFTPSRLRFFGPDGIIKFYDNQDIDKAIAEIRARIALSGPVKIPVITADTGSAFGAPPPSQEFLKLAARLREQIALFGQVGEAAKIAYDIQIGALDALSGPEQQQVLALARQYDALVRNAEAAKKAAAEAKKLEEERQRAIQNIANIIAALEAEVATLNMSERAARLYRLSLEGLEGPQLAHADALLRTIEAHNEMQELMQDASAVFDATRTDLEKFNAELERLNTLRNTIADGKPLIDEETYTRAVKAAREALEGISEMDEFAKQAARNMQSHFAEFLFDPFKEGLDGMVKGFVDAMRRMLAEAAAAAILKQLFGSLATSTNPFLASLGKAFGGSRDSGGRGYPGQAYLIGTGAQPEMFIPDTAGTFVPATRQGAGTTIFQTIVQAPEGRITRESEGRLRARDAQRSGMFAGRNG